MMKKSLLLFLFSTIVTQVFSQNTSKDFSLKKLQEVTIQGNRLQTPFSESARDIQVITQQEIAKMPVHSMNELLSYIGGLDIRQRAPFGGQADVGMDGGSNEETLVLLNGIKLINDQTAHNMMNIPVPLEAIDHIEVLRGAAARVYGINALTGAINIVTKKSGHSFLSADLYAGSSFKEKEKGDGHGIYGGGGIELTGNYGDERQSQLFSISQNWYNGQRYNTAQNNTRLFYNGTYQVDQNNEIRALAGYANNHFGANGFYAAPGDSNSAEIVHTAVFGLSSEHKIGRLTLSPRISDRYDEDDYRYFKDDLKHGRSLHYTNTLMLELNGSLKTAIGDFGLGWESRISSINSSNIGQHDRNNHGAYVEYKNKYWGRVVTNIGMYVNYNTDYGWQAYPGIDLAYLLNNHWKISASAGSGQRIPSFTDLYLNQPPGNVGNPEVEPEDAWQYEADVSYNSGNIVAKAGYFYRDISHFIDWVRERQDEPYSPLNFGDNKVQGLYGRMRQEFTLSETQHLGYSMSYNYLRPTLLTNEKKQSKYVLRTLRHQFIMGLNYKLHQFSIQLNNKLIKRELNDAYDVLDVRLNYQFTPFQVYLDVSNVLDTEYKEAGAVPMPSRWVNLGVKFKLQ